MNKHHFQKIIGNLSIAEYFQIIPLNGSLQFNIDFSLDHDGTYKFTVLYKTKYIPKYDFIKLPLELNHIINSYLNDFDFIFLECLVDLRYDFPFSKPIWHLINVQHSFHHIPISIFDYYKHIVHFHNNMYNENSNWSPVLNIKSDILKFICRINHFEVFHDTIFHTVSFI